MLIAVNPHRSDCQRAGVSRPTSVEQLIVQDSKQSSPCRPPFRPEDWAKIRSVANVPTVSFLAFYYLMGIPLEPTGLGYEGVDDPNANWQAGTQFMFWGILCFSIPRLAGLAWLERLLRLSTPPARRRTVREFRVGLSLFAVAMFTPGAALAVRGLQLFRRVGCAALEPNNWCALYHSVAFWE